MTRAAANVARSMPEKPRVKAPKQRSTPDPGAPVRRRRALLVGGGAAVAAAAVVALIVLLGNGRGGPSEDEVRADLVAAGCTLQVEPQLPAQHSITDPGGTSDKWNTDPPTNGPHYGETAIFGAYDEPLEQARIIHNLEHGGIYIQYGEGVPDSTVEQLRAFYDDHENGTLLAPLPRLGDEIALGAWVSEGEVGDGYLAKCRAFDEDAFSAFFDAFQFKGPERLPPSALAPGS